MAFTRLGMEGTTRVAVACNSRLVAEALMFTFDSDPELEAIGYALDGRQAFELVSTYEPDAVVVEPSLVGLDATALMGWVRTLFPSVAIIELRDTACSADELLNEIRAARARTTVDEHPRRSIGHSPTLELVAAGGFGG